MTEQVSRLAGNLLANGGAVFLPGIGSLYVERRGARRIDRYRVVPPCRMVTFDSQQRGVSLVDAIADILRKNGVEPETAGTQAQSIYDRWANEGHEQGLLPIKGVGVLKFKYFALDSAFDRRLNPHGHSPVRIGKPQRGGDWVLWLGVAAMLFGLIGALCWGLLENSRAGWFGSFCGLSERTSVRSDAGVGRSSTLPAVVYVDDSAPENGGSAATSEPALDSTPLRPEPVRLPVVAGGAASDSEGSYAPRAMASNRSYVALGVFSSLQNAERAARRAVRDGAVASCRIYRFGARFLVSPFESDDREACRSFIVLNRRHYPDMWTYTAR